MRRHELAARPCLPGERRLEKRGREAEGRPQHPSSAKAALPCGARCAAATPMLMHALAGMSMIALGRAVHGRAPVPSRSIPISMHMCL